MNINTKEIDIDLGKKLREQRNRAGLSQTALAEKAGITFQQIQKYETGRNRISTSRLVQLCQVLNIQPTYFYEKIEIQETSLEDQEFQKECNRLVKSFSKIKDPFMRKKIIEIVETFA